MKKFAILAIGIFSGAVTGAWIGESISPDHGAGAGLLIGAIAFVCFWILSGDERQEIKKSQLDE